MICSSSSSSSRLGWRGAVVVVAALVACRHGQRPMPAPFKLAVFPVQNASGGTAPIRPLTEALDAALGARGLEVVPRGNLDAVLAQHRMRFTGGVDRPMAKVLREELGVDAMLVPTLEQHVADAPPKIAMGVRLVGTGERPVVLWADAVARSGNDAPGLLARGLVTSSGELDRTVVAEVARRVEAYVSKGAAGDSCGDAGRFQPRRVFRAPVLDDVGRRSIAVLPFINDTPRRSASDVILGQFVAQLARSGSFEVLDPGFVREELLGHRIVLEGGVSVDNAMALLSLLNADLVLSGYVRQYVGGQGAPRVEFTAYVLDRRTQELVWSSSSLGEGNDGVFFFGAGRVHTASALSCRMVRGVVDHIVGRRGPLGPAD
ncbi:penicillin-binding protein activator LpoB [Anaeromyxobacter oryzae]|uniref:Lipoprotein n=1 Tax=Anaeromyxobacter oryzae TaxID=2918170 RepID=A0ABN6MYB2_9BACT|nr:penicillin-binding protein activator LpoB [Anaeromyxobacter oryzae]BDG05245.1 lipoprotein [Anaeromyxobacter oryzae]